MTSRNGLDRPAHVAFGSAARDQRCARNVGLASECGRIAALRRTDVPGHNQTHAPQQKWIVIRSFHRRGRAT
jgi:hypothetical protein